LLLRLRYIVNFCIVISSTVVIGAAAILVARLFGRVDLAWRLVLCWAGSLTRLCGVTVRAVGLEQVKTDEPAVWMTNHRSHYDTPCIMEAVRMPLHFIAKQELRKIPFLGGAMEVIGMIFLDRRNPEAARRSLQAAAQTVCAGKPVLMFPEGTRSADGVTFQPFKKGGFHLAKEAGVPIQPIAVLGTERVLPKYSLSVRPHPVTIRFGRRIAVTPEKTVEQLLDETRAEMERLIALGP